MCDMNVNNHFAGIVCCGMPQAIGFIRGGNGYDEIKGIIKFFEAPIGGIIVELQISNLPDNPEEPSFYGFHIHENGDCSDDFNKTGGHFNPENKMHPMHAGDMPPIMSQYGYSWMSFWDGALSIEQVIGRSVIIHRKPDDFTTQPSGNSGDKIACGLIVGTE